MRYDSLGRMVWNVEPSTSKPFNPDPNTPGPDVLLTDATTYTARGTVKSVTSSYGDLVTNIVRDAEGKVLETVYGDAASTNSAKGNFGDGVARLASSDLDRGFATAQRLAGLVLDGSLAVYGIRAKGSKHMVTTIVGSVSFPAWLYGTMYEDRAADGRGRALKSIEAIQRLPSATHPAHIAVSQYAGPPECWRLYRASALLLGRRFDPFDIASRFAWVSLPAFVQPSPHCSAIAVARLARGLAQFWSDFDGAVFYVGESRRGSLSALLRSEVGGMFRRWGLPLPTDAGGLVALANRLEVATVEERVDVVQRYFGESYPNGEPRLPRGFSFASLPLDERVKLADAHGATHPAACGNLLFATIDVVRRLRRAPKRMR